MMEKGIVFGMKEEKPTLEMPSEAVESMEQSGYLAPVQEIDDKDFWGHSYCENYEKSVAEPAKKFWEEYWDKQKNDKTT